VGNRTTLENDGEKRRVGNVGEEFDIRRGGSFTNKHNSNT